ncbi:MazG family protein [Desulfovibrio sp. X2]|uniref:nucleoside triphosphate pyrophosphohydrolase n=1 Tax=Desulfovibrio sp. X2 TaxID=941449 RepID=UPI000358C13F|nr:nucleoside triphosphate pyrophosphohydrolase [Desulfovibrio sp. X2]EPR37073.1 MazG family protein [Desulfovibrio sp. X2]
MRNEEALSSLIQVIKSLLAPEGCPWDRKQTPETLCDYVIEESFELVEAIRAGSAEETREEVGDVLFLLLFISELSERAGRFSLADALEESAAKMIRRHPHVFADTKISCQEELLRNWERIKRGEHKDAEGRPAGVFDSLPKGLPPLLRAYRMHSKAARTGFTWASDEDARGQLDAEWKELEEARAGGDAERIEAEFGDYLFTVVEWGRRLGVKANAALDKANNRFLARFQVMEELARERGRDLAELDLDAQNALWDEAKARENPTS